MKKTRYITPQVKTCMMDIDSIMLDGSVTGDNGTGWGGVDESGSQEPAANSSNLWEEEYPTEKDRLSSTIWDSL
ncbi:MAG: hypothetical protein IKT00_12510 [Prevotella sp.]|nr:hypothetical protein [Prevotella sp.]